MDNKAFKDVLNSVCKVKLDVQSMSNEKKGSDPMQTTVTVITQMPTKGKRKSEASKYKQMQATD